jgi:hypothetical protein
MAVKYSKWTSTMPTFSIPRPSKIYPNWDFWFENKTSGNPDRGPTFCFSKHYPQKSFGKKLATFDYSNLCTKIWPKIFTSDHIITNPFQADN